MKVLWICGLPDEVRRVAVGREISPMKTAAWSWVLGHLPPPPDVDLHIVCPVLGLECVRLDFDWRGSHWHCFRQKRFEQLFLWFRMYFQIARFVKELRPDVVHGWGGETGCGWMATLLTRRAIVSVQGLLRLFEDQLQKYGTRRRPSLAARILFFLECQTYCRGHALLTESRVSQAELLRYYGRKSIVVPHPLRAVFCVQPKRMPRPNDLVLLFVGQMTARKGAIDLVRAFAEVEVPANIRLLMIGDGDAQTAVAELVNRLNLSNRVEMRRKCSAEEIRSAMMGASVFVLPSYGDTGPTVLKEALSQGLYPICYDNTGPHELVSKYCGRLVPTGDVDAFARAIEDVLVKLPQCQEEGERASMLIRADVSANQVWEKLKVIYQENRR